MRLTITKVLNKKMLILSLRKIYPDFLFKDCFIIADNLPYEDDRCWMNSKRIEDLLSNCAEYSFTKDEEEGSCNDPINCSHCSPWASQEYIEAQAWYNTLSEEDRKKIDVLVAANVPWA